jgi:acetylornithine deacetylase
MKTQGPVLSEIEISREVLAMDMIALLKTLIAIPSFSREENATADELQSFLEKRGIKTFRKENNVWAKNKFYNPLLPTVLFNSHHDTVKPVAGYTLNPFEAIEKDGKIFGLGSNDAGGALVSLLAAFLHFYENENLKYNIIFAATAEEEISGVNGIELTLPLLGKIDFAIVGEPTKMQPAIAEKGLMVLDCIAKGKASHAAHPDPDNAIIHATKDISWFSNFSFPEKSEWLGDVKMNVTMISSGTQHNIIPSLCVFTVDVRTTDVYSNRSALEIIRKNVSCTVQPRSLRLNSSSVPAHHRFIRTAVEMGLHCFGSATLSDQALMNFPSVKIGPGDSLRSHTADEFIYTAEIKEGIDLYIKLLSAYLL